MNISNEVTADNAFTVRFDIEIRYEAEKNTATAHIHLMEGNHISEGLVAHNQDDKLHTASMASATPVILILHNRVFQGMAMNKKMPRNTERIKNRGPSVKSRTSPV